MSSRVQRLISFWKKPELSMSLACNLRSKLVAKLEGVLRDLTLEPVLWLLCWAAYTTRYTTYNAYTTAYQQCITLLRLGCFLLSSERELEPVGSKWYQWLWISPKDRCVCFHCRSLPSSLKKMSYQYSSICLSDVGGNSPPKLLSIGFAHWRIR